MIEVSGVCQYFATAKVRTVDLMTAKSKERIVARQLKQKNRLIVSHRHKICNTACTYNIRKPFLCIYALKE